MTDARKPRTAEELFRASYMEVMGVIAKHDADIAELRARCEPGEEGRTVAATAGTTAAAADQRAPGSTAPTTEEVEQAAATHDLHGRPIAAQKLRALAADRDKWKAKAAWIDGFQSHLPETEAEVELEDVRVERNALARRLEEATADSREWKSRCRTVNGLYCETLDRLEAMTRREPTAAEWLKMLKLKLKREDAWVHDVWRYVRDTLCATPAPDSTAPPAPLPLLHGPYKMPCGHVSQTFPRCDQCNPAPQPSEGPCDHRGAWSNGRCARCGVDVPAPCSTPAPQPSAGNESMAREANAYARKLYAARTTEADDD